ncbi:MAG: hypothetical protein ACOH1Y_04615 [Propionicimonas sp.]
METFGIVIVVALAAGVVFWWLRRRSVAPVEDQWQLPPEQGEQTPAFPQEPQILDRESVLRLDRAFDPTNWDDTPDGAGSSPAEEAEPGALPTYFDRDYLERKKRGEAPPS